MRKHRYVVVYFLIISLVNVNTVFAGNIPVDVWQTFDFVTLDVTNLAANDNNAGGVWTLDNTSSKLTTSTSGEQLLQGTINTSLNDSGGTRGLDYLLNAATITGIATYNYAADHGTVSFGFWFKAPTSWLDTFEEHDIFYVENITGVRELYIKMGDQGDNPLLNLYLFTAEQGYSTSIQITAGQWYWVTCIYDRTTNHKLRVYDASGVQVGAEKTRTSTGQDSIQVSIGSLVGSESATASDSLYWDDLLMDWTNATFPLGPGTASAGRALKVRGKVNIRGIVKFR